MSTKQKKSIRVHWFWEHNEEKEQLIKHCITAYTQGHMEICSNIIPTEHTARSIQVHPGAFTAVHKTEVKFKTWPQAEVQCSSHYANSCRCRAETHKTRRPGRHPELAQHHPADSGSVSWSSPSLLTAPRVPSTDPLNPRTARAER